MGSFVWRGFKLVVAAALIMAVLGGVLVGVALVTPLPRPEVADATELYDINGRLITRLRGPNFENRTTISRSQMPDYLRQAVVAIEDERFYRHFGIDPVAIARAAYRDIKARKIVEGGSTITQQLAKNLFLTQERTFERKFREAFYTIALEAEYSKEEILTMYLNEAYMGHGTYGMEAASALYFGKHASELTLSEAATLAGIVRVPEYYTPYRRPEVAVNRRDLVLELMVRQGYLSPTAAEEAKQEEVTLAGIPSTSNPAPYFVSYVVDQVSERHPLLARNIYSGGYKIYTTLNLDAQVAANQALEAHLDQLDAVARGDGNVQLALVAMDPTNGHIVAMLGGRQYAGDMNRAVAAHRQPGSAFKPVLYSAVLERGNTVIDTQVCEYVEYPNGDGSLYIPKDHAASRGQPYHWRPLTVREAVAVSDNVVAVRWANQVKPAAIIDMARRMGLPMNEQRARQAGLSLALGSYEVTPLELTQAYATLANGGYRVEPLSVVRVVDPQGRVLEDNTPEATRVISEDLAYLVTNVLKSVFDPALDGTAAHLRWSLEGRPAAAKTGTSQDQTDAWFAGYTTDLAAAVWVGFDERRDIGEGAWGGTLAGPIWADFIREASKGLEKTDFPIPRNIRTVEICPESGLLPDFYFAGKTIKEVFITGTEPTNPCPSPNPWPWPFGAPDEGTRDTGQGSSGLNEAELDDLRRRTGVVDESGAGDSPSEKPGETAGNDDAVDPTNPAEPTEPVDPEAPATPGDGDEPTEPEDSGDQTTPGGETGAPSPAPQEPPAGQVPP